MAVSCSKAIVANFVAILLCVILANLVDTEVNLSGDKVAQVHYF